MKAKSRKKAASRFQKPVPVEGQTSAVQSGNTPGSGPTAMTVAKAWPAARPMDRINHTPEVSERQARAPAGAGLGPNASGDFIVDVDSDGDGMMFWFAGRSR